MTKIEIDKAFKSGEKIGYQCYSRSNLYFCGKERITSKQFSEFLNRFKDQYIIKSEFGGITKHIYIYKPKEI
jgi:hypothetical protein